MGGMREVEVPLVQAEGRLLWALAAVVIRVGVCVSRQAQAGAVLVTARYPRSGRGQAPRQARV